MKTKLFKTKVLLLFAVFAIHLNAQAQLRQSQTNATQSTALQQAKENPAADIHNPENQSPFDAVKGLKEDLSKRDAFSKHYINEDGSFTALIGAGPIHYERNGQFLDIDHTITQSSTMNFPFANTTNLMESYFGATVEYGVKSKTMEGEVVEFMNPTMYWEVNGQAMGTQQAANTQAQIQADKATYPNIYGDISAEYKVLTGKREMNYIIPNPQALGAVPAGADYLVFTEDVVLPFGWTSSLTEMGIMIKDAMGQEIYLYENPHSTDAESHALREENTIFETLQIGNTLTIKTKVKTEWLLSNERVFPVMVDPTVVDASAVGSRSVYNTNSYTSNNGYFGRNNDGYTAFWLQYHIKFNVSSIPSGSIVTATSGYINVFEYSGTTHNNNQWHWSISSDPTTTTGTTLYNSANYRLSNSISISANHGGWNNINFITNVPNPLLYVEEGINDAGFVNATVRPDGTYNPANMYRAYTHSDTNKPYLRITYTEPITDRTLEVVGAGDGASHVDGSYTYDNDTPLVLTSGTRAGYELMGWTGTGNVPPTGTTNSIAFNITQNSSIEWLWEAIQPEFHNYGGEEQLAFNNSKINTENPVFRLSHKGGTANGYQIQISNSADFTSGTAYSQTFTGTYAAEEENNFTFTNGSFTSGTTYYVRAAVDMGGGYLTDGWTTETYSFTYQDDQEIPSWFQTTQAQFETDALSGVEANASHDVVTNPGGNMIVNGTFANTSGWATHKTWNGLIIEVSSTDCVNCPVGTTRNLKFSDWAESDTGDFMVVSQQVDLTNVDEITYNANSYYNSGSYPPTNRISSLRFIIGGSSTDEVGTTLHTTEQAFINSPYQSISSSDPNITINTSEYTGIQTIKFVVSFTSPGYLRSALINYYVNNVEAISSSSGTITSTPIHLASVQDTEGYLGLRWNQTLNGGDMILKVQHSADGETGWTDVPGYTDISAEGDGEQYFDLELMEAYPHIRLVGALDGQNVVLHDWAIEFKKDIPEDCKITTTWNGIDWSHGYPTESPKKQVVFEADYTFDSDEIMYACEVMIDDEVLVSANSSLLVDEFVMVSEDGWLVIESGGTVEVDDEFLTEGIVEVGGDLIVHGAVINYEEDPEYFVIWDGGNLVQINDDAVNSGKITAEKGFTFSAEKNQYNFVISPVVGQNIKELFENNNYKAQWYNETTNYFVFFEGEYLGAGIGQAIQENQNGGLVQTATYEGEPHNGIIKVDSLSNGYSRYHLAGNPYPSHLDLVKFYEDNQYNLESTIRFWDNRGNTQITQQGDDYGGSNYALFNAASSPDGTGTAAPGATDSLRVPTKDVAVGNAFLLRLLAEPAETSYTFNNAQRTIGQGQNFLGRNTTEGNASSSVDRYWLTMHTPGQISVMNAVVYFEGGNDAFAKDDSKITGGSDDIYSIVEEHKLKIQGKSSFEISDTIALGYKAFHAGTHSINLYQSEGVFTEGVNILLIDKALEITQNLSAEGSYSFTTEAGEFQERFIIVYEEQGTEEPEEPEEPDEPLANVEIEKGGLIVYKHGNQTVISSDQVDLLQLEVFNLQGQKLMNRDKIHAKTYRLDNERLGKQALLLVVTTADGKEHSFKILTQ